MSNPGRQAAFDAMVAEGSTFRYEPDDDGVLQWHTRYNGGGDWQYYPGFVDGYRAAEHDLAQREQAATDRERIASQLERDTRIAMAEQEERHRRTLEVLDAEVARLKARAAFAEKELIEFRDLAALYMIESDYVASGPDGGPVIEPCPELAALRRMCDRAARR